MADGQKEITVRRAALYDVPAMARIETNSFAAPWSAAEITKDVTAGGNVYVAVAEADGEVVGYADVWMVAGEAQLYNVVVDSGMRGMHVGTRLMEHVMEVCCDAGCTLMTLEVRAGNTPAIAMYHSLGFRDAAVRRGYYTDNKEDALLMDKDLNAVEVDYSIDVDVEVGSEH